MNNSIPKFAADYVPLSARFRDACALAWDVHGASPRKGTAIPYLSHVLSVAALVMEFGGDEDEAIAALLHDAVEDAGDDDAGKAMLARIRRDFGDEVANIVDACSDSWGEPKPPWKERKLDYLAAIPTKSAPARLVSCCDKLHNARCIRRDYESVGDELWTRFNSPRDEVLWYYEQLARTFDETGPAEPAAALALVVSLITQRAKKRLMSR